MFTQATSPPSTSARATFAATSSVGAVDRITTASGSIAPILLDRDALAAERELDGPEPELVHGPRELVAATRLEEREAGPRRDAPARQQARVAQAAVDALLAPRRAVG